MANLAELILLGVVGVIFLVVTGVVLSRSRLPEVQNLGRMFARIPGLGRFIRPDEDKALSVGVADASDLLSVQLSANDAFTATPVPPPMSAGVVRGPKLVPGAPVSDGRFRLLSECGSVQYARFWKAREIKTGKDVALTFVDVTAQAPFAPKSPAEVARTAAEVSRRTRKLAELNHSGIARNVRILSYRSGALIVADWVEGSSLRDVAETAANADNDVLLNPRAVALALAPLAVAAADAEGAGTPLGLDNSSRIRISTNGRAVLAFPAVLPDASIPEDVSSLASAIEILADGTYDPADNGELDEELGQIAVDARAVANEAAEEAESTGSETTASASTEVSDGNNAKVRDIAARLRRFGHSPDESTDESSDDQASDRISRAASLAGSRAAGTAGVSSTRTGFGSRSYSSPSTMLIAGTAVALVVLAAAVTTWLASVVSGDDAPVSPESIQGEQAPVAPRQLPLVIRPSQAQLWSPAGAHVSEDHPEDTSKLIDDNVATVWSSNAYPNGLGTKPGVGITVHAHKPVVLHRLRINSVAEGSSFSVYAIPAGTDVNALEDPSELQRVGQGATASGQLTVELEPTAQPVDGVLVWMTDPGQAASSFSLREIEFVGNYPDSEQWAERTDA